MAADRQPGPQRTGRGRGVTPRPQDRDTAATTEEESVKDIPSDIIGYVPMEDGDHHLTGGFCFRREGDEIVVTDRLGVEHQVRVSLSEWASVLAHTSVDGDTGEKHRGALSFLGESGG